MFLNLVPNNFCYVFSLITPLLKKEFFDVNSFYLNIQK